MGTGGTCLPPSQSRLLLCLLLLLLSHVSAQAPGAAPADPTPDSVTPAPATLAPVTPAPATLAPVTPSPQTLPPAVTNPPLTQAPTLSATQAPILTQPPTPAATQTPVLTQTPLLTQTPTLPVTPIPTLPVTTTATPVVTLPPPTKAATLPPTIAPTVPAPTITIPVTTPPNLPTTPPFLTPPAAATLAPTTTAPTNFAATPGALPSATTRAPSVSTAVPAPTLNPTLTPAPVPTGSAGNPIPTPLVTTTIATPSPNAPLPTNPSTNITNGSNPPNGVSSAPVANTTTNISKEKSSLPVWVIPVAIVGGAAVLGLVGLALFLCCCMTQKKKRAPDAEQGPEWKEDGFGSPREPVLPVYENGGAFKSSQASNRAPSRQTSAGPRTVPASAGGASSRASGGTGTTASSARVRPCSLQELQTATDNFDPAYKLGAGGFGTVYRGVLPSGKEIAVKRSGQGQKDYNQFRNEVELLSRLHHRHLVGLLGYCDDDGEQILVYEFMANGAISEHFKDRKLPLSWQSRLTVALGAARGLDYLHNWADPPIVHRDVKSDNILLDETFNAKVADFGLSRLPPTAQTMTMSGVKGTFGYIDPNYAAGQPLTKKSDVYSFGVVLLQLVSGRLAVDLTRPQAEWSVVEWARPFLHEKRFTPLIDPRMGEYSVEELATLCTLVGRMVSRQASARPHMADVVRTLEQLVTSSSGGPAGDESAVFDTAYDDGDMAPLDMSQFAYNSSTQGSGFGQSGSSERTSGSSEASGFASSARSRGEVRSSGVGNPRSRGGDSRASRGSNIRSSEVGNTDTWQRGTGQPFLEQPPSAMFTRLQESRLHEGR